MIQEQDATLLAGKLWAEAREHEQSAAVITDDQLANDVRDRVRRLAAGEDVRVRTARMGDTVVVVRLDAAVWNDDAATMRRKLAPPR